MQWNWSWIRSIPARVFVCSVLNLNQLSTSWLAGRSSKTLQYVPGLKLVAVPYYLNEVKLLSIESNTPRCHCDTDSAKYRREVRVRSTVCNAEIEAVV